MLKKYIITALLLALLVNALAQSSDIRGEVVDQSQSPLSGAIVELKKDNVRVNARVVAPDGGFIFSGLPSGKYELIVTYLGFADAKLTISLQPDQSLYKTIVLSTNTEVKDEIKIIHVKIDEDRPVVEEIESGPYNNGLIAATNDPALIKRGEKIQAGIARPEQLAILKNGLNQIGPTVPITFGLAQVKVLTVGVPAMYGDFLGAAIEFTPKTILDTTAQKRIMIRSSSPFNAYHQNAVETFWYKPLQKRNGKTSLAISHSFFLDYQKDRSPAAVDLYQLKPETYAEILEQPLVSMGDIGEVSVPNQFLVEDFEQISARANAASNEAFTSLKLEWKPSDDVIFRIEPTVQYRRRNQWSFSNSLLNAAHNPLNTSLTTKLNAQVEHVLKSPYSSDGKYVYDSSLVSKISYTVTADYQRLNTKTVDPIHGDDVFGYGHVGQFTTHGQEVYDFVDEAKTIVDQHGKEQVIQGYYSLAGYQDTAVLFSANAANGQRAAFTDHVLENNDIANLGELSQVQGILNGRNPSSINGMWYAPGTVLSNYSKSDWQKTTISTLVNFSVNPTRSLKEQHDFQFGVLFEQQRRSYYSLNANSLWQLMPQLLNRQFGELDPTSATLSYDSEGMFTDTVRYNYAVNPASQTTFDQNLRSLVDAQNGHTTGGAQFIDVNAVDPSLLSLSMFSADELWNNGNSYVGYAGYDYTGKLSRGNKSIGDFLNNSDKREIGAYNPNYSAVWLQDKFVIKKIKIRAGLRAERFDANQQVLKDQFVLYPTQTVGEVAVLGGQSVTHPEVISKDAVVYVDDMLNPSNIVGYREGRAWYNAEGKELQSGESLRIAATSGVIQPLLANPRTQQLSQNSFEDYDPQILLLPRLSLSFPLNGSAMFYAYYDKFAQRPNFGQSFAPINTYYYLANGSNTLLPNPGLKPAKRTDYQVGFKQRVGERGLLNFRVGYAEIRDDINLVNADQAYPRSYITYDNIDFSTVKSFNLDFSTQLKNVSIRTNYVLQYADGTGSNVNSASALIQSGQPNLRSLYPLEYDIRHKLNANLSVVMDSFARKPNGVFRRMRANIFANTLSGTPYTAYAVALPEAVTLGSANRSQIKGNPFGSRMPWNYTIDASISKAFIVKKRAIIVQLNALNVLNIQNVFSVYPFSSQANDDGYLASAQGQQQLRNELNAAAFANYYSLKQNNPQNFGSPRTITLSIRTRF
ncbi:MAG: carboxypeptidase regulatory-like domain-containing protein [Bacteroidia bacterium]